MRHEPFKNRLLVCDMDGTLLDSSSKLSVENRAALDRFVAGGGLFTVATGRMEESVMQYLDELPVNVPAILYNGAAIYDFQKNKLLWQDNLPPGVAEPVKEVIGYFPGIGVQLYHGGKIYTIRENEYTIAHMRRENLKPLVAEIDNVPQPWFKIILEWEPKKLREVENFLDNFDMPFRRVYSEPQFLELLSSSASKGNALKVLIRMLKLEKSGVIAIGDNLNDVELIREATVGIAVENAHDMLKDAADLCCSHHNMNAVSEVIRWLEEGRIVC